MERRSAYTRLAAGVGACVLTAVVLFGWTCSILAEDRFESRLSAIHISLNGLANEPTGELVEGVVVSESFVARADRLTEVAVQLATYARENSAAVEFTLSQTLDGAPLRTVEVSPFDIVDNAYHPFRFEPITGSTGQEYFASIRSRQGRPGNAFTVWIANCDCYPEGAAYINGTRQDGRDLALAVGYASENRGVGWELVNRLSQYKPEFVKGMALVFLASATAALTVLAAGAMAREVVNGGREQEFSWAWVAASLAFGLALALIVW